MQLALGTGVQEKHTEIERETDFIEFKTQVCLGEHQFLSIFFFFNECFLDVS